MSDKFNLDVTIRVAEPTSNRPQSNVAGCDPKTILNGCIITKDCDSNMTGCQ